MGAYLSSPITTKVSGENNQGRDRRAREKTETNDGHGRRQCSQAATHISLSLPFSLSLLPSHFTLRKTGDARRRVRGLCVRRLGDAGLAHGDGKKRKRGEIKRETEAFAVLHRGRGKKGARLSSPRLSLSLALFYPTLCPPTHPSRPTHTRILSLFRLDQTIEKRKNRRKNTASETRDKNRDLKIKMPDDIFLKIMFYSFGAFWVYIILKLLGNMYKKRS